jgi:hypothetical protein
MTLKIYPPNLSPASTISTMELDAELARVALILTKVALVLLLAIAATLYAYLYLMRAVLLPLAHVLVVGCLAASLFRSARVQRDAIPELLALMEVAALLYLQLYL